MTGRAGKLSPAEPRATTMSSIPLLLDDVDVVEMLVVLQEAVDERRLDGT